MSEKVDAHKIEGPFGVDRRDSAIARRSPGILAKLENFMIDQGAAEVREGISRQATTSLNADYPVLALHRFYGLDALEAEVKEFYAAVDGASDVKIKKYDSGSWTDMNMPPEITLTSPEDGASIGNFEQFKDRTYFTNQKENVLMIRQEDNQIYEAGIPDADAELEIAFMETLDVDTHATLVGAGGAGKWAIYTDGDANQVRYYRDEGFERHTEGDYGLTLSQSDSGKTLSAIYRLPSVLNLEFFYQNVSSTVTTADADGVLLTDSTRTGSLAFDSSYLGLQVSNATDGSDAVIIQIVSGTSVITTPLTGGTDNEWGSGDSYIIGSISTDYDYIALDIFRFAKGPIDELVIEFSGYDPTDDGHFVRGNYIVIYTDNDYEHFSLKQRTMLAQWVMNPYNNRLFFGRFRKRWFIPLKPRGSASLNHATTLQDTGNGTGRARPKFTADMVGMTVENVSTSTTGTISAFVSSTELTTNIAWSAGDTYEISSTDDFSSVKYFKIHMMHNAQTVSTEAARVTIDNVRLLKTPPIPAAKSIQVATCDSREEWTGTEDDVSRSTEGVSCKKISSGDTGVYAWTGTRDFSQYGEGSEVSGGDIFVFDVGGELSTVSSVVTAVTLTDSNAKTVIGIFTVFGDLANIQQRHIHIQEFNQLTAVATPADRFDWSSVSSLTVTNAVSPEYPGSFAALYIDNIRIQPASASKLINKFMPLDLIIGDALSKGIEHFFGENSILDVISDWLFAAYANFTRKVVGQGRMTYPDYTHGRYKVGSQDEVNRTLPCLGLQVDAGGELSVTFTQDDDLTQYNEFNFNLDGFLSPKPENTDGNFLGIDWIEIEGSPTDEFSIWFSTSNMANINEIRFRLYANANAEFDADSRSHEGVDGTRYVEWTGPATDIVGLVGRRVRNESWVTGHAGSRWGIIGGVYHNTPGNWNRAYTFGMEWDNGDIFTIDTLTNKGFQFGRLGKNKPEIDKDNYYEYVFDVQQMVGSLQGVSKALEKAIRSGDITNNEEYIAWTRDLYRQQGLQLVYHERGRRRREKRHFMDKAADVIGEVGPILGAATGTSLFEAAGIFGAGKAFSAAIRPDSRTKVGGYVEEGDVRRHEGWGAGILVWKRSDMIPHLTDNSPWSSMQSIAAHEIIVKANSKENAFITFQDFRITKKGAVHGEQLKYKIKLEDDQGYLGPASEDSKGITAQGNDVNLTNIYVPYDNRIMRKRIYRTDQYGVYRLLDVIDRLETTYLDQIPEELLGEAMEPSYYRPPKAAFMRAVDNRMAYIDCIDRRGTRRSSRIHFSLPFVPHQVDDMDCFDLMPEDGQRVMWCEAYYGHLLVWKERSLYTVDLQSFEKTPRDLSIGCVAPRSVAAVPGKGFGWLSHEGVIFGDHTSVDMDVGDQIWDDIKDFTPAQLSRAIGWYKDRYYYIFFGYDTNTNNYSTTIGGSAGGYYNGIGFACYIPNMTWTKITNWNIQCVSVWRGGTDSGEVYAGSRYGYVNKLHDGEVDLTDDSASPATEEQILSHLKAVDYDYGKPHTDKYLEWLILHARNLSSDPTRKAILTFTPFYDQVATAVMNDERIEHSTYKKYDLCHNRDEGGDTGTLIGFELDGIKRYAIKDITAVINDLGFVPVQQRGTY